MGYVFWCAACGNPDIIVEDTKSGYSMGKGIVGAAVLGPVGAVAGLDGKKTTSYYCPKCGARLDHCMPDYQVSNILMMLKNPEMNRSAIEREHERFPNMMMPKGWVSENSTGTANVSETMTTQKILGKPDYSELKRILQISKGSDAVDRIHAFFLKNGYLSEKDVTDFRISLGCFPTESPEYTLIHNAMNELEESYKLRIVFYHGEQVYEAAKDREEARAWRYEALADKIPVDDYLEFVKQLISIKSRTVKEVEQEIINNYPGINDDNPYTALSLAKRTCLELSKKDGLISYDGEEIRKRSTKLTEDDLRWDIEESWRKSEVTRDGVESIRAMVPIMKSKNAVSLSELGQLARATTQQKMAVRLKQLVDAGYCTKQKIGGTVYYSLTPEAKAWTAKEFENFIIAAQRTRFVKEEKKALAAKKLKDKSGFSFFDIMGDEIKDSYEMQKFYECFMILELEGNARKIEKPKEYIWEFIDKQAEARKKLEERKQKARKELIDEKQRLEQELERIKKENEKKIPEWEEKAKKARSRVFDGSELMARISELESTKNALEKKLSSLGFFSFKEKKQVNQEITECDKKLEEAQGKLDTAQEAFNQSVEYEISSCQENIERANNEISVKSRQIQVIENKIKYLDDEKQVESISDLEAILATGKPARS